MAKENKELPGIIPQNEYQDDLEADVRFHVARIMASNTIPKITKKYTHVEYPDFGGDKRAQLDWEMEEIRRCMHGYDNLPGKFYYYFNHCMIDHKSRGSIRPDFRAIDVEWFRQIEECQKSQKYGLVIVKRRQVGASLRAAADILHDCTFNKHFKVGMNSKSEEDSRGMFENVKMIHQQLPDFLRPVATASNRRDKMIFARKGKDAMGNPRMEGTQSSIISVAPTIAAHAGKRYRKLIIDEAGEQCWGSGTLIKLFSGDNKKAEDVVVGDSIMGINSEELKVIATTVGESEMYLITPTKGEPFQCNGNHLLTLKFNGRENFINIPVKDFIKLDPIKQRYYQLVRKGVEYTKQDYYFDPYWFGLWLGDGSKSGPEVVSIDKEIKDYLLEVAPLQHKCNHSSYFQNEKTGLQTIYLKAANYKIKVTEHSGKEEYFKNIEQCCDYYNVGFKTYKQILTGVDIPTFKPHKNRGYKQMAKYVAKIESVESSPRNELAKLGVLDNKFIPECYMKTSREDRLKLLAGIIDSDGHKDKRKNGYEVTFSLPHLALQLQELCRSLGFYASLNIKPVKNYKYKDGRTGSIHYRVGIFGNTLHEIPCILPRKKITEVATKTRGRRDPDKSGFKVESIGTGTYYGFQLDKSPYFLLGDYTVAHNCDLLPMWAKSEPCISQDSLRVGIPIIFGTVGEISKAGKGLMEMYLNAESYDLKRFAVWGYNAMFIDEYGNDIVSEGVRYIIYKRKKLESAAKRVRDEFYQMFPLNQNDAFLNVNVSGIGNPKLISDQYLKLQDDPPQKSVGVMRRNSDNSVDFVPNPNGSVIVYERPDPMRKNGYVAGADPADHDDLEKQRDTSNLALSIVSKPYGGDPPKLCLELVSRPLKLDEWFREAAMCLQWYNNTKVLAEDNRARMVNYFKENFPQLLAMTPKGVNSVRGGIELKYGIKMTAERKEQMRGLIESYIDDYSEFIPSLRLLEEFKEFGSEHGTDDLAVSFGWSLFLLQSDKSPVKNASQSDPNIPQATFKKVNGTIQIVNQGKPVLQKPKFQPNSQLFRR